MSEHLTVAAASGDHLATLEAMRDLLARTMTETDSARDVAALAARLADTLAQIAKLKSQAPAEQSAVDQIAERRARRRPIRPGVAR